MGQGASSQRARSRTRGLPETGLVTTHLRGLQALQIRRLISCGKLAPCAAGQDEDESGKVLSCRGGASEATCPFCAASGYSVLFSGPKTAAQRDLEAREAADTLQRQRSGREAEELESQERARMLLAAGGVGPPVEGSLAAELAKAEAAEAEFRAARTARARENANKMRLLAEASELSRGTYFDEEGSDTLLDVEEMMVMQAINDSLVDAEEQAQGGANSPSDAPSAGVSTERDAPEESSHVGRIGVQPPARHIGSNMGGGYDSVAALRQLNAVLGQLPGSPGRSGSSSDDAEALRKLIEGLGLLMSPSGAVMEISDDVEALRRLIDGLGRLPGSASSATASMPRADVEPPNGQPEIDSICRDVSSASSSARVRLAAALQLLNGPLRRLSQGSGGIPLPLEPRNLIATSANAGPAIVSSHSGGSQTPPSTAPTGVEAHEQPTPADAALPRPLGIPLLERPCGRGAEHLPGASDPRVWELSADELAAVVACRPSFVGMATAAPLPLQLRHVMAPSVSEVKRPVISGGCAGTPPQACEANCATPAAAVATDNVAAEVLISAGGSPAMADEAPPTGPAAAAPRAGGAAVVKDSGPSKAIQQCPTVSSSHLLPAAGVNGATIAADGATDSGEFMVGCNSSDPGGPAYVRHPDGEVQLALLINSMYQPPAEAPPGGRRSIPMYQATIAVETYQAPLDPHDQEVQAAIAAADAAVQRVYTQPAWSLISGDSSADDAFRLRLEARGREDATRMEAARQADGRLKASLERYDQASLL